MDKIAADAFLINPNNYSGIDHTDTITRNNCCRDLEWFEEEEETEVEKEEIKK